MLVKSIRLYNFRNLKDEVLVPATVINLITGANGQGKTNLIEAIYLLAHGRSFRTSRASELIRWGETGASVFAVIESMNELGAPAQYELGIALTVSGREVFFNGDRESSFANILGKIVCVSFTPTDVGLVKGAPQYRRKFFDRHVTDCEPGRLRHYVNYQRALKSKAALLRAESHEDAIIDSWDQILAAEGEVIERARIELINELVPRVGRYMQTLAPRDGEFELRLDRELAQPASREVLLEEFRTARKRETAQGRCLVGPHREDFLILVGARDARAFASQGQARSIALSLKLAVIDLLEEKRGEPPIILLDDVDSELDNGRKAALSSLIFAGERQVFVTGTELREAASQSQGVKLIRVEGGTLEVNQ